MPQPRLPSGFEQHIVEPAGLDLSSDPLDSQCLYAMNVSFRNVGRVGPRSGYLPLTDGTVPSAFSNVAMFRAGTTTYALYRQSATQWIAKRFVLSGSDITYSIAASAAPPITSAARVDTPTGSSMYIAAGWSSGTLYGLRKFDGTAFSAPAGTAPTIPPDPNLAQRAAITDAASAASVRMPAAWHLAVAPWDNSLIAAATDGGLSRIEFSRPGKPEVWQVNSFEDFSPGDGEPILGMVAWRDKVFVFKHTKFTVYYTTTYNSDGLPEYQRTDYYNQPGIVWNGVVSADSMIGKVCAADDGVYYCGTDGIYRTTGREPIKVSGPLDPLWTGARPLRSGIESYAENQGWQRITAYDRQVVASRRINHETLYLPSAVVLDTGTGRWATWRFAYATFGMVITALAGTTLSATESGEIYTRPAHALAMFFGSMDAGLGMLTRLDGGQLGDGNDDVPITTRYWTGLLDLGTPNEKILRETIVEASEPRARALLESGGLLSVRVSSPGAVDGSSTTYTVPAEDSASPIQPVRHRLSHRGRWFQIKVTELVADIHQFRLHVGSVRGPSMDE